MAERKLLVGPDPDGSTFEKAFSSAARLPTEEDRKRAMEKGFRDVIREDLHRDSAYQRDTQQRDTRRPAGTNGWLLEQPLVNADTDRTNRLIEGMCNASPQPTTPTVNIAALRGVDEHVVRAKLEDACAKGQISRTQLEEALRALGHAR